MAPEEHAVGKQQSHASLARAPCGRGGMPRPHQIASNRDYALGGTIGAIGACRRETAELRGLAGSQDSGGRSSLQCQHAYARRAVRGKPRHTSARHKRNFLATRRLSTSDRPAHDANPASQTVQLLRGAVNKELASVNAFTQIQSAARRFRDYFALNYMLSTSPVIYINMTSVATWLTCSATRTCKSALHHVAVVPTEHSKSADSKGAKGAYRKIIKLTLFSPSDDAIQPSTDVGMGAFSSLSVVADRHEVTAIPRPAAATVSDTQWASPSTRPAAVLAMQAPSSGHAKRAAMRRGPHRASVRASGMTCSMAGMSTNSRLATMNVADVVWPLGKLYVECTADGRERAK
eukprot:297846-Chlamydomonas_euryale.AAC.4